MTFRWSPLVLRALFGAAFTCAVAATPLMAAQAQTGVFAPIPTISPTTTLSAGHVCYTDGRDIACDSNGPTLSGLGMNDRIVSSTYGLTINGATGYVSLTSGASTVGYLAPSGFSYLPGLNTLGVSATGTVSATNGYFAGNVGIGVVSPTRPLDVGGPVRFRGNIYLDSGNYFTNSALGGTLNIGGSETDRLNLIFGGVTMFRSTGYVGIGTSSPSSTLHVSGTTALMGNVGIGTISPSNTLNVYGTDLRVQSNSNSRYITTTPGNGTIDFNTGLLGYINRGNANQSFIINPNGVGPVGIDLTTATPSATLDVSGTIKMADSYESCDATHLGGMKYNAVSATFSICRVAANGWEPITAGSASATTVTAFASLTTDVSASAANGTLMAGTITGAANAPTNTTSFGYGALMTATNSGYQNTAFGNLSLNTNTTGYQNVAVGATALASNTNGFQNTAVGALALGRATGTTQNTGVGYAAGGGLTSGGRNTAIGGGALSGATTGGQNVAIGYAAAQGNPTSNIAIGNFSLRASTGNANVGIGDRSLLAINTGSYNTAVGAATASAAGAVNNLTLVGYQSGASITTAGDSVMLGYNSGYNVTTGASNTLLGWGAGSGLITGGNNIMIGYNVQPQTNADNNTLNIGNTIYGNTSGKVIGINTAYPSATLDVSGTVKMADSYESCDATHLGGMKYNAVSATFSICRVAANGWEVLTAGAASVSTVLGDRITSGTQTAIINSATGVVSLSTAGTDWGYLNPTSFSYLPYLNTLGVSATGVVSASGGYFAGNVGIGTAPVATYALVVSGSGGTSQIQFKTGSNNAYVGLLSGNALHLNNQGAYPVVLDTNGTERMRIDPTGLVGIGTTVPSVTLNVSGTIRMAYGNENCDANRLGGMQYNNGQFYICRNGTSWEALTAGAASATTVTALASLTTDVSASAANGTLMAGTITGAALAPTNTTSFGYGALAAAANNGYQNTAFGNNALNKNTTGTANTAVGYNALLTQTGGGSNVAVGVSAMQSTTTATNDVAVGYQSLLNNTTGSQNTAVGQQAMQGNTIGFRNAAFGYQALAGNSSGSNNVAMGYFALLSSLAGSGSNNTGLGVYVMRFNGGNNNVGVGYNALLQNTSGSNNTALGVSAASGQNSQYGNNGVYVGYQAGASIGTGGNDNTMLGYQAGVNIIAGASNTLVGWGAGSGLTTGSNNIMLGNSVQAVTNTTNYGLNIGNSIFGSMTNASSTGGAALIGINTAYPSATLHVSGTAIIGYDGTSQTCDTNRLGAIRYTGGNFSICRVAANGWETLTAGSASASTALGDRIVSGTYTEIINSATGVVSLSTAGTDWGYLNPTGFSYLPGLNTLGVSATGVVSATLLYATSGAVVGPYVQVTSDTMICGAGQAGRITYGGGSINYCNGAAWVSLSSSTAALGDRITSGTSAAILNSSTGITSLSTAGTTWGYLGSVSSYLPGLTSTNISATTVQLTSDTTACSSAIAGRLSYVSGSLLLCNGTSWSNVGVGVPAGTISAFASSCPAGWTEYTPARGRFLRGIDNGAGLDPGGTRAPGNQQTDAEQIVTGQFKVAGFTGGIDTASGAFYNTSGGGFPSAAATGSSSGYGVLDTSRVARTANETRPSNVAVTFCQYTGIGGGGGGSVSVTSIAAGNTTDVQYNAGGVMAGTDSFSWNNSTTLLTVVGSISATNVSASVASINSLAAGLLTATTASATNVSATNLQLGAGSTCSAAADGGKMRYNGTALQYCNGSAWTTSSGVGVSTLASLTDVSISNPVVNNVLAFTGVSWTNLPVQKVMSTTTMLPNFPDAIVCNVSSPSFGSAVFYNLGSGSGSNVTYAFTPGSTSYQIYFNSTTGAFSSYSNLTTTNCNTSISALYATGQAFNFIGTSTAGAAVGTNAVQYSNGGNLAASGLTYISSTGFFGINQAAPNAALDVLGLVSATSVSSTNISSSLGSVNSLAAGLLTATTASATNVSATNLQLGVGGSCSAAADGGKLRYNGTALQYCNGSAWTAAGTGTGVGTLISLTDVSLSNLGTGQILRYNGVSWTNVGVSQALSTTTLQANFPDGLVCTSSAGDKWYYMIGSKADNSNAGQVYYYHVGYSGRYMQFNSDGTWNTEANGTSNCSSKTISQLYATGQAFNFIGSNLSSAATPNTSLQYSNNGTLAGSGMYYVSGTNALGLGTATPTSSLTVIGEAQVSSSGAVCATANAGAIRYASASLSYCNGTAWTSLSSNTTVALSDRITSGTSAAILNSSTGITSLSTAGTTWGYLGSVSSYLPGLTSTNISATTVQLTSDTTACSSAIAGRLSYVSGSLLLCNGTSWSNVGVGVPAGTISAFASSCPAGWTEYTPARGAFLRGIDNGAGLDPSGTRVPGSYQADMFKSHSHNISAGGSGVNGLAVTNGSGADDSNYAFSDVTKASAATFLADPVGGSETRPKNVAVTFCQYTGIGGVGGGSVSVTSIAAGNTTDVQYNSGGAMAGSDSFTWNNGSSLLTATNISASNVSASVASINSLAAGLLTATTASATNVSATNLQLGAGSTCSAAADGGKMRYNGTALQYCNGSAWTTSSGAGVATLASLTDVSISNPVVNNVLAFTGVSWTNLPVQKVMSTTTMVSGWPDAIVCRTSNRGQVTFYADLMPYSGDGKYYYEEPGSADNPNYVVTYNPDGTYSTTINITLVGSSCNVSMAANYAAGAAFNFIGSSNIGAAIGTNAVQYSNSGTMAASGLLYTSSTNAFALGTPVTGASLTIAGLVASNQESTGGLAVSGVASITTVSGTNVSATNLQLGVGGSCSAAADGGKMRYVSNTLQYCNGSAWTTSSGVGVSTLASLTDVSISNPVVNNVLAFTGVSWTNLPVQKVMSTTTMIPNWPDAITCTSSGSPVIGYFNNVNSGLTYYSMPVDSSGSRFYVAFNTSDGSYNSSSNLGGFDCVTNTWSINQLYALGKAFNFIGTSTTGAAVGTNAVQYSNSGNLAASGLLYTSGTNAFALGTPVTGASLTVAGLVASNQESTGGLAVSGVASITTVSGTNVSATNLQLGVGGSCSAAADGGKMRYNGTALQYCNGTTWTTSSGAGVATLASLTDVSLSNLVTNNILAFTGVSWTNLPVQKVMSTTTMLPNLPDAIACTNSGATNTFYLAQKNASTAYYRFIYNTGGDLYITYNATTGAYTGQTGSTGYDCVTNAYSLSQLYAQGQAYNFIGSNLSSAATPNTSLQYSNNGTLAGSGMYYVSSTGRVGVGATNPAAMLEADSAVAATSGIYGYNTATGNMGLLAVNNVGVQGTVSGTGTSYGVYGLSSGASGSGVFGYNSSNAAQGGLGTATGYGVYCAAGTCGGVNAWTNTSDVRLKKNIVDITYGLATIEQLRPVFYDWKHPLAGQAGRQVGLIAQEVEKIVPEVVSTAKDASQTKSIAYSNLVPVLIKSVQELKAENDTLKAQNDALAKRLDRLEALTATKH